MHNNTAGGSKMSNLTANITQMHAKPQHLHVTIKGHLDFSRGASGLAAISDAARKAKLSNVFQDASDFHGYMSLSDRFRLATSISNILSQRSEGSIRAE